MAIPTLLVRLWNSFSFVGLAVAALFFAASLTPSLLPRHFAVQGLLSGVALAVGYGIGVGFVALWKYLELPPPAARLDRISKWITAIVVAIVAASFLWRATVWQNSVRGLMEMDPVASAYPFRVAAIAVLVGTFLVLAARGLACCWRGVHRRIKQIVPRRVSIVLSTTLVVVILVLLANQLLGRIALNAADAMFLQIDEVVDDDISKPTDPQSTGSEASLVTWDSIGRQGKLFITGGPSQQTISEFFDDDALRPLRIYVGLRTAESVEQRAQLALDELIRVGGFDRSLLIVATPTGTGWLDPGAVDTIEYLHRGDTAIVAMQYSYLPSWITILIDPERSRVAARALFDRVYAHWTSLPKDDRPKLYVHGLSLGALGSETSADLFTLFEDPIQGGMWSGPPFPSSLWQRITQARRADSPRWLPIHRDGSMVRFMGRTGPAEPSEKPWGRMRFVYIQHASDPMTFFSPSLLYRRPDWLMGQRGPDVSPYLRWYPIVTFLQTAFDLPMATSVPHGFGHNFDASSYIDAWTTVTEPGLDERTVARLKESFAER